MLHVCAFWRQVALGSQALWARVHFFCPQKALRAGTQAGLELWLKRAGGHRISLAFTCPRQHITVQDAGDVSCSDILRMLLLCSAKWRNLHLSVSKSCKLEDQPLAGLSFQTLEMVRFSADQHTSPAIHKMLSAGTRLTSLDIDIVDCDRRRVADILGVLTAITRDPNDRWERRLSLSHTLDQRNPSQDRGFPDICPPFALPIAQVARHHQFRWTIMRLSQLPQAA